MPKKNGRFNNEIKRNLIGQNLLFIYFLLSNMLIPERTMAFPLTWLIVGEKGCERFGNTVIPWKNVSFHNSGILKLALNGIAIEHFFGTKETPAILNKINKKHFEFTFFFILTSAKEKRKIKIEPQLCKDLLLLRNRCDGPDKLK